MLRPNCTNIESEPLLQANLQAAVIDQVRVLLQQPEVVIATWRTARADAPDLTEAETRAALERLDALWEELFPAEQTRIVRLLVERVDISPIGADIRLRLEGLASLTRDLTTGGTAHRTAA